MIYYETSVAIEEANRQLNSANTEFAVYIRDYPERDEAVVAELRKKIKMLRLTLDELREMQSNNDATVRMLKIPNPADVLHVKALQRAPASECATVRGPCGNTNRNRPPANR